MGEAPSARHSRKYGEQTSYPIPIWNGVFDHYLRIRDAIWEFAWCIDRITVERDGVGIVLGGSPVKLSAIVDTIKGSKKETVRRHLDRLEKQNYIRRRRTPYGYVIEVLNSCKFEIWKTPKGKPQNDVSPIAGKPIHEPEKPISGSEKPKNSINKEDAAGTQHKDAAVGATHTAAAIGTLNPWKILGNDLPMGSLRFQKLFEHYAATRNGNTLSDAMERTIQIANQQGVKVPPPFFGAKRDVERREQEELVTHAVDVPVLEGEPWAK